MLVSGRGYYAYRRHSILLCVPNIHFSERHIADMKQNTMKMVELLFAIACPPGDAVVQPCGHYLARAHDRR